MDAIRRDGENPLQATCGFPETEFGCVLTTCYADGLRYDGQHYSVRVDRDMDCVEVFLCWPALGWPSTRDLAPGMKGYRPFFSLKPDEDARHPSAVIGYPAKSAAAPDHGAVGYARMLRAYLSQWPPPGAPPPERTRP